MKKHVEPYKPPVRSMPVFDSSSREYPFAASLRKPCCRVKYDQLALFFYIISLVNELSKSTGQLLNKEELLMTLSDPEDGFYHLGVGLYHLTILRDKATKDRNELKVWCGTLQEKVEDAVLRLVLVTSL